MVVKLPTIHGLTCRTALALIAGVLVCVPAAIAQAYPAKTVRVIVPYSTGGGSSAEFGRFIRDEIVKWGKVIKAAEITIE